MYLNISKTIIEIKIMRRLKSAYELSLERAIKPKNERIHEASESFEFVTDFEYPEEKKITTEDEVIMRDSETIPFSEKPIEVHWEGNVLDYGGFGRVNRTCVFGLSNRHVAVKVGIQQYHENVNKATGNMLREMSKTPISDKAPKVFGASMPMDMGHSGKKILFTMIETGQSIHKDYSEKLNLFDEIWVPTENGKALLRNNSVYPPIYVIPLGVHADRYNPNIAPLKLNTRLNDFRFISVFKWSYRKGPDLLLKAYLEEFSAKDNVSLLLVTRALNVPEEVGFKVIKEDFDAVKASINKPEEELPHIALYPELVPERKMPSLYKSCDAFILLSRGEGFGLPYCFLKDTPIKTDYGHKCIQDIKIGEMVLTCKGRYRQVTETHKNKVCSEISHIETMLGGNLDVTSNHAFQAIKKPDKRDYKGRGKSLSKYLSSCKLEWTRAQDLSVGDYLVYPIRKEWGNIKHVIDVLDYTDSSNVIEYKKNRIYNRFSNGSISNEDISKKAGVSKRQVEHFKQDGKVGKEAKLRIESALSKISIESQKSCINRHIPLDVNLAKLLGYYCAEGNLLSNESGIELHFHLNEIKYHKDVCRLIKKCVGINAVVTHKKYKNVTNIRVCNSMLASVFKHLCGNHAINKKIPKLVLESSQEVIQSFLNGYINGDGHSSYDANILSISTASKEMAIEYQSLMMDHGEACSFQKDKRGIYNCTVSGSPTVDFVEKDIRHKSDNVRWCVWKDKKNIYIPITKIHKEEKSEIVYNIDVEDDHSYIAGIVVAHNCEASACGLPVIGTNCTGQMDFLNTENSFLVDPQEYAISSLGSVGTYSKMAKMSHFYEDQYFPVFGGESIGQAKRHMRYIYENKALAQEKNEKLRKDIIKKYNWEDTITKIYNRIAESQ